MRRIRRVRDGADEGQLLLLVLAYTLVAALLVTVVVNLSKAFLYRRSLVAAVDGAALAAANQPDLERIYTGSGRALPLSDEGARDSVEQYVADGCCPSTPTAGRSPCGSVRPYECRSRIC